MRSLSQGALILVLSAGLLSCAKPQPLPAGAPGEYRAGRYLDAVWLSPDFKRSSRFAITTSWGEHPASEPVRAHLEQRTRALTDPQATYRLSLRFDRFGGPPPLGFLSTGPYLEVHGKVEDGSGRVLALFENRRPTIFPLASNEQSAIDDSLRWISIDLGPEN